MDARMRPQPEKDQLSYPSGWSEAKPLCSMDLPTDCRLMVIAVDATGGPLFRPETVAAVSGAPCRGAGVRCAGSSGDWGCPNAHPVWAGSDAGHHPSCADPGWLTSAAERTARLPACRPGLRRRHADGRSVRRMSAVAVLSAVLSAAGCDRVRRGRLDGCLGARCPRCWRNRDRCPDGAVHRGHCRGLRGVRCYRKRSPGPRPLVGCNHRRQARQICRLSRWRSCLRT